MFDTQEPQIIGLHKEFISSARLDNMCSSICATHAIVEAEESKERDLSIAVLYDHEEIGSSSAQGAAGTFTNDLLRRVFNQFYQGEEREKEEDYQTVARRSFFVSADMAHAHHPNYGGVH